MSLRFLLTPLLILLATVAARAADPVLPDLAIESYRLPNGLKVVLHRDRSVPRVSVIVAYHVGSKDERAGRTGFAHFFEHMMFRGTKGVPSYDIPLQETGGQSNAFTNEDVTVYHETVPTSYLERALYLEAERLAFLPSALDQEKFDTEREVVKNERRQSYENVPYGLAEEALLANVFPKGHPYSWSVIGSMADLNGATLKDLKRFFLEYYQPANACLCLAGDFDPAEAKAWISKYFAPLAAGKAPERPRPSSTPPPDVRLTQGDRVSLPRVYWAWPSIPDEHPDSAPLDLLSDILTDGDASRLHSSLVIEERVASDVSATSDTKEIGGLFTVQATAAEGKDLKTLEAALQREFDRLKAEPPTQAELTRALAKFEKKNYSRLTSPMTRGLALAIGYLEKDDPAYYRRDIARYFKVTPADLARVASTYLTPRKVALEVVPLGPGIKKAQATVAGPAPATVVESDIPERTPAPGPDWSKMPGPGTEQKFQAPTPVRRTLSNGIEVAIIPWRTLPIVTGSWIVPAGTADDPEAKAGLAEITASLVTKGTKDRPAKTFTEELDALGVSYGCSADNDSTALTFDVLKRNLDPALKLLTPMFTEPRFDPDDFEVVRNLHLAELTQGPDRVNWLAQRALRALLFGPDHPYGRPGDGSVGSVKGITLEDVKAFHKARYVANGSRLVISGDVDPDALIRTLETILGRWKTAGAPLAKIPGPRTGHENGVIYLVDKPGAVQSVIRIGRPWVKSADPRYYATEIGNHVFGVDFLSRLNKNLREKNGYTYGAGSRFAYRRGGGVWVASASVRGDATAPALKEMIRELDGVSGKDPLKPEEVQLGRDAVSRSFPESFEDPHSIAGILTSIATHGLPDDYMSALLPRIRSANPDEIRATFADLASKEARTILVVGDRKLIEPKLKALGLGEVRVIDADGKAIKP
jgi:zinc protease